MNHLLEAALYYREKCDLSVIPLSPGSKVPPKGFSVTPYRERKATPDEIRQWWKENARYNVGIVTGKLSGIFVVDLDRQKPNFREDLEHEFFPDTLETATARTPSGGTHLYFQYPDRDVTIGASDIAIDYRGEGGYIVAPPSCNGNGRGYEWIVPLNGTSKVLARVPEKYINYIYNNIYSFSLYKGYVRNEKGSNLHNITDLTNAYSEGRRNEDLFHAANLMFRGRGETEFIYKTLKLLANQCDPPYPQHEVDAVIQSILSRAARRTRKIAEEIREWVSLQTGYFDITSCLRDLQILTKEEKNAAYVAIKRLQDDGIIEKYGEARGVYRPIQAFDDEKLEFIEGKIEEFPVKLPLNLNDLVSIYPRNIIVVAGTKSAGKTALLLHIAHSNQDLHDVVYLNSEMGPEEFSTRMKKMGIMRADEIRFSVLSRSSNFHDRITGERKIFIIDYIEQHENFSEIAIQIRKIHEKLKDGICFIAIQKKTGERLGRGGEFSMEKARLYLTMEYVDQMRATRIDIVDAKAPKIPGGARGLFRYIKVHDSATIKTIPGEEWKR